MLASHLRLALKVLLRRPFFTLISLFGICVTLVVLMTAAAVLDHMAGTAPPEIHKHRSLIVQRIELRGRDFLVVTQPGYAFLDRYVRALEGVERVTVFTDPKRAASFRGGKKTELQLKRTDGAFWRVMEFRFLEGGPYSGEDDAAGVPLAVINESTRRRLFGGPPAVGREAVVDGQRFRVVGVVADVSSLHDRPFADIWVPIGSATASVYRGEYLGGFGAVVLARRAADLPAVKRELASRIAGFQVAGFPEHSVKAGVDTAGEALARSLLSETVGSAGVIGHTTQLSAVPLGVALLFLLLPSVNLINITFSRMLERLSEIGIRRAFGATTGDLVAQFVLENVVLTLAGGVLGLGLTALVLRMVSATHLVPYAELHLSLRVLACGMLMAFVLGILSGVYPAWRVSRLHPVQALRGSSR